MAACGLKKKETQSCFFGPLLLDLHSNFCSFLIPGSRKS
uniref:Golgi apparatus membrane protein TVP23 n=1 Tax=Rhizophora mucronata TaxID=61149 RepID=A0A2P2IXG6_RHIMU